MKSFYDKEDYTIEDIQALIDNQVEESIYLDFKSAGSLEKTDKKRIELSKDIAAFANSDGGIIIYGIKEVDHVASEYSFIDGNEFTKEWIETIITSCIQRRISDVQIFPLRIDGDFRKSIYVVKIPFSYNAPHINKDNRYYKRYNFMSVPMEEYEVRQSYNRKERTVIAVDDIIISQGGASTQGQTLLITTRYHLAFQVSNNGNSIENQFKLEIHLPSQIVTASNSNPVTKHFVRNEGNTSVYSIPNESPLFQSERTTIINAYIEFNSHTAALIHSPIKIKLYFSNGVIEQVFNLGNSYTYQHKPLSEWAWR